MYTKDSRDKKSSKKFGNPKSKKFWKDKRERDRRKKKEKRKSEQAVAAEKVATVYKPSFVVYEPFSCPSEIESASFAESSIRYRRSDGKVNFFRKGQLVLNHPGGIVSVLDGRYGKVI